MKDKRLLYLLGAGTLTGLAGTAGAQQQRPNIIYMMADQLRADVLGYAGDGLAVTPNIDRFARQSLDFTNAVSVSPVSAAYRASLITGKYTSSTGMVIQRTEPESQPPDPGPCAHGCRLPDRLRGQSPLERCPPPSLQAGARAHGIRRLLGGLFVQPHQLQRILRYGRSRRRAVHVDLKGQYGPEVFTGLALDYIREHAGDEQPFTLMLSWSPTHDPGSAGTFRRIVTRDSKT